MTCTNYDVLIVTYWRWHTMTCWWWRKNNVIATMIYRQRHSLIDNDILALTFWHWRTDNDSLTVYSRCIWCCREIINFSFQSSHSLPPFSWHFHPPSPASLPSPLSSSTLQPPSPSQARSKLTSMGSTCGARSRLGEFLRGRNSFKWSSLTSKWRAVAPSSLRMSYRLFWGSGLYGGRGLKIGYLGTE